ncbi:MAG: cupin domain-containing protein [Acidihalobacter sp.]
MENVEADFHAHEHADERFIVLKGRLVLEPEEETVALLAGHSDTVGKGTRHRAKAHQRVELLTIMEQDAPANGGT